MAERDGIEIPRTVEEYTKRVDEQPATRPGSDLQDYLEDDDDDDDGEEEDQQSESSQFTEAYSQGKSRTKLNGHSEIRLALRTAMNSESKHNNNNSSGDYNDHLCKKYSSGDMNNSSF